ncbi:ABC transporter ATP-binding protein [Taklimakanibacter deserti]|uniref:ABC transporter ATP-binding protein n=1 Tax=Taklimakanibacter deserti TaxID=2267839 RepID=UPI000E65E3A1
MLSVKGLSVHYGAIRALREASISVARGELVALLGPNGAGKTSLISGIAGLVRAAGEVVFEGKEIQRLATEDRVRRGLSVTPEGRHVFANLTVAENLRLGAATRRDRDGVGQDIEKYLGLFPILRERNRQLAGTLSGGEQQMLAIARAMMSRPSLLMLDEPSLGLAPRIVAQMFDYVSRLKEEGVTLLVVEQNVMQALKHADRAYVISSGIIRHEGRAEELRGDPKLIESYLGS